MTVFRLLALAGAAALLTSCAGPAEPPPPASASASSPTDQASPSVPAPPPAGPTTFLALGDSVAADVGAEPPEGAGYVPRLAGLLAEWLGCADPERPGCPVQLADLAAAGATTGTVLREQLPQALDVLRTTDGRRLITLTVGGNDVFVPVLVGCGREPRGSACEQAVTAALERTRADLAVLLPALREAAGPTAVIAVMTYYDPVPSCQLAPLAGLSARVLDGDGDDGGLNGVLRAAAGAVGATVVETGGGLLGPDDLIGGQDCLHPDNSGHGLVAEAFLDAVAGPVTDGTADGTAGG